MAETLRPWASPQERLDVLDLACGHGMYGFTLAQQHPQARVWSVDNPRVLEIAQKHAARMGVADRVTSGRRLTCSRCHWAARTTLY